MPLKVPFRRYSIDEFLETLYRIDMEPHRHLKLACFLTRFETWREEQKRYDLERILQNRDIKTTEMGQIRELRGRYRDRELKKDRLAVFYAYVDPESRLMLCFTDEKNEAIQHIFGSNVADFVDGFYYLFIRPNTFDLVAKKIYEEYPLSYCSFFIATHRPEFQTKGATRPNYDRTIRYTGADALEVLNEVKQFYGVIPTTMGFSVPDFGSYQIRSDGIFTHRSPQIRKGRRYLSHLANIILHDVLALKKIGDTASYQVIPVRTEKRVFEIEEITPAKISFGQKLEFGDAESLIQSLSRNGYAVFNHNLQEGSLIMSGMLTDGNKGNLFTFDVDSERILIAPIGEPTFDGFLRLYRTLTDHFDSNATCEAFVEEY